MASVLEFPRGDGTYHNFLFPASSWSVGGRLFFAAKPVIDDDNTDTNAVIQANWGDDVVSDVTVKGVAYKKYVCYFPPAATDSILSDGADEAEYLGEFQWVPATGIPVTIPPTDPKIPVIVYFDVKRKTIV